MRARGCQIPQYKGPAGIVDCIYYDKKKSHKTEVLEDVCLDENSCPLTSSIIIFSNAYAMSGFHTRNFRLE